ILFVEVYLTSHCQFTRNGSRPFVCRLDSPFTKASRQTRKLDNCNWNLTYNITINLCDFHRAISYRDAVDVNIILGIIASIACGLGAVLCTIYSKQLSRAGWTSSMILSKRFYGIILFSFFFTYDLIFDYTMENISWILVVTIIGVL